MGAIDRDSRHREDALLARALDPARAERALAAPLDRVRECRAPLTEAQLIRHKPGRRALVRYRCADGLVVYGKIRARGADTRTHALLERLWEAGCRPGGDRGFAVPRPLGIVEEWSMLLLLEAPGRLASELAETAEGSDALDRVGRALAALHDGVAPARRRHGLGDELRILAERLEPLRQGFDDTRVDRLLSACRAAARELPEQATAPVHRDFYPDQVLVDGDLVTLLDLDLYSESQPALDVGNFAAHLVEQALRRGGDARGLRHVEDAFVAGYRSRRDLDATALAGWTALALARLAGLAAVLPGRAHTSGAMLSLCEERLGLRS